MNKWRIISHSVNVSPSGCLQATCFFGIDFILLFFYFKLFSSQFHVFQCCFDFLFRCSLFCSILSFSTVFLLFTEISGAFTLHWLKMLFCHLASFGRIAHDLKQSSRVQISRKRWSQLDLHPGAVHLQWEHHWPMICSAWQQVPKNSLSIWTICLVTLCIVVFSRHCWAERSVPFFLSISQ